AEVHPGAPEMRHARLDRHLVVVPRRLEIAAVGFHHRQLDARLLDRAIAHAERPHHLGAADLEPAEGVRVICEPHLVGVAGPDTHQKSKHQPSIGTMGGGVFHRWWSQNHIGGWRLIHSSSFAVWSAVSSRTAASPRLSGSGSGGSTSSSWRPSGRRVPKPMM